MQSSTVRRFVPRHLRAGGIIIQSALGQQHLVWFISHQSADRDPSYQQ